MVSVLYKDGGGEKRAGKAVRPQKPERKQPEIWGDSVTFSRQLRSVSFYLFLLMLGQALITLGQTPFWHSLGMGLLLPGGGFLNAIMIDYSQFWHALLLFSLAIMLFVLSLFLWFATGNALAPPLTWITLTVLPLLFHENIPILGNMVLCSSTPTSNLQESLQLAPFNIHSLLSFAMIAVTLLLLVVMFYQEYQGKQRLAVLRSHKAENDSLLGLEGLQNKTAFKALSQHVLTGRGVPDDELSPADIRRIRLVLDRALQPVNQFEGFEWKDQFQTASVRFQVNALSYALSVVQHSKLPAFQGYYTQAQHNLAAKMLDHRVWGYWQLENMWGNLKRSPDPIALDTNIMLTGFYGLQLTMFQAAAGIENYNKADCLTFAHPKGARFDYDLPHFLEVLKIGYNRSAFGLMPCEPNWIYPLCNIMSVAAMSMHDRQFETQYWGDIKQPFAQSLERDFLTPEGGFKTLVSSYTGLSLSKVGGGIMQAFPIIFLNHVLPEMARTQWQKFRTDLLKREDSRKAFWPIDVGNYGYARGAGFVAGAAAAVEMGDGEVADILLRFLEEDHSEVIVEGVAHREKLSLWAHCYEVIARCGEAGQFAKMGTGQQPQNKTSSPFITEARYEEILVAKAVTDKGLLEAVFYPTNSAGHYTITAGGLDIEGRYSVVSIGDQKVKKQSVMADDDGQAKISLFIKGRTQFFLKKIS